MINEHVHLLNFKPAEAETITGLTAVMQRDWRERGILPAKSGHARYDVFELAEMLALKVLSDRGVGPMTAKLMSGRSARGIAFHILSSVEAYDGRPDALLHRSAPSLYPEPTWKEATGAVKAMLFASAGRPKDVPCRFCVLWANGNVDWVSSLDVAYGESSSDPKYHGPAIVLDLQALADLMIERASRPFVRIGEA